MVYSMNWSNDHFLKSNIFIWLLLVKSIGDDQKRKQRIIKKPKELDESIDKFYFSNWGLSWYFPITIWQFQRCHFSLQNVVQYNKIDYKFHLNVIYNFIYNIWFLMS